MKLLLVIWVIVSMIGVAASVWMIYRKTHPKLCDTCKNLVMKTSRFYCRFMDGGFDIAPSYCSYHEPREAESDGVF